MSDPCIIGIDPGRNGGLAADVGGVVHTARMPLVGNDLDVQGIQDWIEALGEPDLVVIEEQAPNAFRNVPKPAQAAFGQGRHYGSLLTLTKLLAWPTLVVAPQRWQKAVPGLSVGKRTGESHNAHTKRVKARRIEVAQRLYPRADITGSSHHAAKAHDGIADALLILEAARTLTARSSA